MDSQTDLDGRKDGRSDGWINILQTYRHTDTQAYRHIDIYTFNSYLFVYFLIAFFLHCTYVWYPNTMCIYIYMFIDITTSVTTYVIRVCFVLQ